MNPAAKKARIAADKFAGKEVHFLPILHEDDEVAKVLLQEPVEISAACKDLDGQWAPGHGLLSFYKPEKLPYDLNHKYDEWHHVELGRAELTFEPIMKHLTEQVGGCVRRGGGKMAARRRWRGLAAAAAAAAVTPGFLGFLACLLRCLACLLVCCWAGGAGGGSRGHGWVVSWRGWCRCWWCWWCRRCWRWWRLRSTRAQLRLTHSRTHALTHSLARSLTPHTHTLH
jgi:hypothetical protein